VPKPLEEREDNQALRAKRLDSLLEYASKLATHVEPDSKRFRDFFEEYHFLYYPKLTERTRELDFQWVLKSLRQRGLRAEDIDDDNQSTTKNEEGNALTLQNFAGEGGEDASQ
jgi:hypothetical protein